MRFEYPALLLLLVTLPWFWRSGAARDHERRRRTIWRTVVASCLILAAAGLKIATHEAPMTAVVAFDVSASLPPRAQQRALTRVNALAATMHARDQVGIIAFGAEAAIERRPGREFPVASIASVVPVTATNIAVALDLARAALPPDGLRRIVLVSDGLATAGRTDAAVARAAAAGVPIDVLAPDLGGLRRAPSVTRVAAPASVKIAVPFDVSVDLEGSADAQGLLSIFRDDQPFASREFTLSTSGRASVTVSDSHGVAGVHTYRAEVRAPGESGMEPDANDSGSGVVVSVTGEQRVLHVSASGALPASALVSAGFQVAPMAPESLPASAAALAAYDTIILDDVPSERLTPSQMAAIARHVTDAGGGLLVLGSPRTLKPGGYPTGPLGPVLPLDLRPRSGRRAPVAGLVLVFDKSGSMSDLGGGTPKIDLARQAVMRVLDVLPPSDRFGVIAFDSAPTTVVPLAAAAAAEARDVADRLKAIQPGGPTQLAPAVELAIRWLRDEVDTSATRRHVLLISDGHTSAADVERLGHALQGSGVEFSAVAIGTDADRALLRGLTEPSGGRVYFPADIRDLPTIVAREAARSAGGAVVAESFVVQAKPHPILSGLDRSAMPRMEGYVAAALKPTATGVLSSHLDDPVFGVWRVGLGRVGVFTGDLGSSWSASLRQWAGAPRLWTQATRWLSRQTDDKALHVLLDEEDGAMRLVVDAERPDGSAIDLSPVRAVVHPPSADGQDLQLLPSAPGRYEATVPLTAVGPYIVSIDANDRDEGTERRVVRGFYWSAVRERRSAAVDILRLSSLARTTGGRILGASDSPFDGPRPSAYTPLRRWLAAGAVVMFALELVFYRGLPLRSLVAGRHSR